MTGTIGSITGPQDGGAIGLASQNSRGFLDVTFGFLEGQTPDLASIYDLEPEFAINPATGGASYSIALDATQAPVLLAHVDGSTTWTLRYWTTGSYTSGAVTVSLIAGSIRFQNGALSTATDTLTIAAPASANVGYLDVNYQPVSGFELDVATIVDPAAEFTLGGAGAGTGVTQSSTYAPLRLTNSNTFRYFLQGDFVAGEVTVDFAANSVQSVQPGTDPEIRIGNAAKQQKFIVQVLNATLENPRNGDALDVDDLNQRGYIDVTFQLPAYAESIDVATVTDLDPELKVTLDTGAALALDESQAPVLVSQNATSYTFRYWTTGTFDSAHVHVAFRRTGDRIDIDGVVGHADGRRKVVDRRAGLVQGDAAVVERHGADEGRTAQRAAHGHARRGTAMEVRNEIRELRNQKGVVPRGICRCLRRSPHLHGASGTGRAS